jgi:hypothetical protein
MAEVPMLAGGWYGFWRGAPPRAFSSAAAQVGGVAMRMRAALLLSLLACHSSSSSSSSSTLPPGSAPPPPLTDTDYHRGPWNFNPQCPKAVTLDPIGKQRQPGTE